MELSNKINPLKKLILILSAIGFMSCNDEPTGNSITTPTMPSTTIMENFGNQINSDFMGRVVDPQNNPISGAMIQIGNSTTDTDSNGVFILKNIQVYEKFAYIKVEKPGFLHGSRSLVPTSGINKVKIMLLPQTVTETVSSGIAETVSLANGASVDLAGAYAKSDGTEYNGDIQVTLHFLNPTDENMEQQMPGMLLAQNIQNEARMLETLHKIQRLRQKILHKLLALVLSPLSSACCAIDACFFKSVIYFFNFEIGPKENKLGIRGSDTHTLQFNDVKIPKENRIGEDGFGFKFAMKTLSGGRIGIAAQALGIAAGAYELSLKYSKERKAFGTEISNHQAIAFKLAEMATDIEAARLLVYKAALDKDQGNNYDTSSAMAKLYASKVAMQHSVEAVQIHGGNGFVKDYHVERLMRDAKITQIYEGTSEIQKIVISRAVLKD